MTHHENTRVSRALLLPCCLLAAIGCGDSRSGDSGSGDAGETATEGSEIADGDEADESGDADGETGDGDATDDTDDTDGETGDGDATDDTDTDDTDTDTDTGDPYCGNGTVDDDEECDDGNQDNSDGCTTECLAAMCGDGFVQAGEQCDDGNFVDEDACSNACVLGSFDVQLPVDLGSAIGFAILAKSGISTVPASSITGDIGVSPAAATYITGFDLIADPSNQFSTSTQVIGRVYASTYAVPTPANLTTAVSDMELAYTDAAGRPPDVTELGAGNIGGMILPAGVYKWGTGLLIPSDLTLSGNSTDVWIFQIAGDLTVSSGTNVFLTGGALPKNVFWQVAGLVDLDTTAHGEGIVLTQTSITLHTSASINGRLLAQTAVDIAISTVVEPAP